MSHLCGGEDVSRAIINTSSLNSVPYLQSFLSAIIGFFKNTHLSSGTTVMLQRGRRGGCTVCND
jgi:hypothetical protein